MYKQPKEATRLGFFDKNDSIATEKAFQEALNKEYDFDFDPCPLERPDWDGLEVTWGKRNWVNPPFSHINKWVEKAVTEMMKGHFTVMLIPSRPNTEYWRKWVFPFASEIHYLPKTRFEGYDLPLPVPLVLVIFNPDKIPVFKKTIRGNKECWSVATGGI